MAIYVYKNKLEIYSAGKLMDGITLDNLKTAHPSVKRNEKMANVFYSMKFVESWGQGIRKVMDGCIFNGNPEPEFSFMGPGLLVTMRSNKEVEEESVPIHIDDLDEVNRLILGMMTSNPYTNVSDMASAVGLSERTILRRIRDLKKVGLVSREGNNMSGAWVIIK
jgi:ATP-dependent DNA helicase RecG